MDPYSILSKLETPDECERFAENVAKSRPDLLDLPRLSKRRAVELRAAKEKASKPSEQAALRAIFAYEAFLTEKNGRKTSASRTWQMINRHGILKAVERAVDREDDASGFVALNKMGMEDLSLENVIIKFESEFSPRAVMRAKERLERYHELVEGAK